MTKRKATKKDAPKPVELAPVDEPARTQEEQEAPPTPQEYERAFKESFDTRRCWPIP
jgi:hypothetical protein